MLAAESVPAHIEEDHLLHQPLAERADGETKDNVRYFEACLPIEEIARRGRDTLRFGPMKPMGLTDPRTGRRPYAVVQLRQENARAGSYNLVGFQNHMRFGEQQRVAADDSRPGTRRNPALRPGASEHLYQRPGAARADAAASRPIPEFSLPDRFRASRVTSNRLPPDWSRDARPPRLATGETPQALFRAQTAIGSLCAYVTGADPANYQPANITFDLLPKLENPPRDKRVRQTEVCRRALAALEEYLPVRV